MKQKDPAREARFTMILQQVLKKKEPGDLISYEEIKPFIAGDNVYSYRSAIAKWVAMTLNRELIGQRGKGWRIAAGADQLKLGDGRRKRATKLLAGAMVSYMTIQPDELSPHQRMHLDVALARTASELHGLQKSNASIKKLANTKMPELPKPSKK